MMFVSIFTAQATPLGDGAIIYVGSSQMAQEDVEGWAPTGVSGPIVYDETNHVLTLNELAFTQPLDIDASAFWSDEFTIRIEGTAMTTFEMQAQTAIRFRGGQGLIIEGEKGTGLSISINNVSGNGGCGIMCATTFSTSMASSDYLPLTIRGGVSVGVNNYGANENQYAAVIAAPVSIKNSDLSAITTDGTGLDAVQTGSGISGISTLHSQWMSYDEYDNYFWEWKAYSEMYYDIRVNGYYLTDRRRTLSKDDMANIKNGVLTYDPEKNILELSGGFELEAHDGSSSGIVYTGSEPLTIRLNSYSPVTISEKSMSSGYAALCARGPVIIDLNGCDMELTSTYGSSLLIEDEVKIVNSMGIGLPDVAEKKKLTIVSPNGYGIRGNDTDAKLVIDRANVVAGAVSGSVVEIPTELNHVVLESGFDWNSDNSVVEEGTGNVADDPMNPVHFNISAWQLATTIWPAGAGHVNISDGTNTFEDLYFFSENKDVQMTPVPNEGWEFLMWADMSKLSPRDVSLIVSDGSVNFQADFVRLIESETQWYTIIEVGGTRSIFALENKLRGIGSKIADLVPFDDHSIVCAAFANGYLHYIETNSLGSKSWLVRASFDGSVLGTAEVLTPDADAEKYSSFYNITYSDRDGCFYAFCKRMSDSKVYLVKISPDDGAITEISGVAAGYSVDGLVVDEHGLLYTFFNGDQMYVADPTIPMSDMKVGDVDCYLYGVSTTAVFNDPTTGELFVFDDDIFWRVNKSNASVEPVWLLSTLNTNCVFSLAQKYTITVDVESGNGKVWLTGDVKTAKFDKDAEVTLNAKGDPGWKFEQWNDGNTDNPRIVTVTEDKIYNATFVIDPDVDVYPILIGGIPFYTGNLTMTKENNPAIKNGEAIYDPENRTLTIQEQLEIEVTSGDYGLFIDNDGYGETVNVVVGTGSSPLKISDKSALGASAVRISAPVVWDIYGLDVEISSDNGKALEIENELTVRNSGNENYALKVNAINNYGISGYGTDAKLIIDHCKLQATGSLGSIYTIPLTMQGVTYDETLFDWDDINATMMDHGTTTPATATVAFTINEWKLTAVANEGHGTVTIKDGETVLDNPFYFDADKTVTVTADPAEGWNFWFWSNFSMDNPQTLDLTTSLGNQSIWAYFSKKVNTEKSWLAVVQDGSDYAIMKLEDKLTKCDTKVADIPVATGDKLLCSEYAGEAFYYITTTSSEDNFSMFKAAFDGETLGTPETLVDASYAYYGFKDIVYSSANECFYGVCTETATGDEIWAKIALDGVVMRVAEMPAGTDVYALTATNSGIIYALVKPTSGYPELHTVTFTETTVNFTKVGEMDNTGLYGTYQTAIWFDNVSNELFNISSGVVWLTNQTTAKLEPVAFAPATISRVFAIQAPAPTYTITVKVADGQESLGEVNINGSGTSGSFEEGASVTLNAVATDPNYVFDKWDDDDTAPATRTITVTSDATFTASFKEKTVGVQYTLTISAGAHGSVNESVNGKYDEGTNVTIIATPDAGYIFNQWSDGDKNATRVVTMNSNITLEASFLSSTTYTVKITADKGELDELHGKVKVNDGDEKKKFEGVFNGGTIITVEAVPEEGYTVDEWSDDEDNKNLIREIEVTKNLDIKVSFRELRKVTLTVNIKPANGGKVEMNGEVREGNQLKVTEGKSITVTAIPAEGFKFKGWENAQGEIFETDAETGIKMKSSKEITAVFEEAQGFENIEVEGAPARKMLINGQLYILRDGKIFNASGARVE